MTMVNWQWRRRGLETGRVSTIGAPGIPVVADDHHVDASPPTPHD